MRENRESSDRDGATGFRADDAQGPASARVFVRRCGLIAATLLLVLGVRGTAVAEEGPTWFIAEANAGVAFPSGLMDDAVGSAIRAAFGVGGRPWGLPIRLYGLFSVGHSHLASEVRQSVFRSDLDRDLVDVVGGARLLIPLGAGVRIYGDLLGGWGTMLSQIDVNGVEHLDASTSGFALAAGGGLQVRFMRLLAIGLRVEWSGLFVDDRVDFASEAAGLPSPAQGEARGRTSVMATATFHF